jgi:beta-lactamase regulating signal transducer with metallopeptidase domain
MISLDTLLNAYIDANIILIVGALIWGVLQMILQRTPIEHAHSTRLKLLYGVLVIVGLMPFVVMALWPTLRTLSGGAGLNFNLSDIIVAEYLNGRFTMAPTTFEGVLTARNELVHQITARNTTTGNIIATVLLLGIGLATLKAAVNLTRVRRVIQQSYHWRQVGNLQIRLTDASSIPFSTRGFRRSYIVIPYEMLATPADLRIALAHELQHVRQGDLIWEAVLELLRPLFVFNPVMRYWKAQVETLRELACDQQVMQRRQVKAHDYASCLLRVCTNAIERQQRVATPAVALVQARGARNATFLTLRIAEMMRMPARTSGRWTVALLLAPLAMAIALSSVAIQQSGDWSQDRLMLSTIVNLERLNQRNGLN